MDIQFRKKGLLGYLCLYGNFSRTFLKSIGFQNLRHASRTIKGNGTIHALYKQRRSLQKGSAFSVSNELQQLLTASEIWFLIYQSVYAFFRYLNRTFIIVGGIPGGQEYEIQ